MVNDQKYDCSVRKTYSIIAFLVEYGLYKSYHIWIWLGIVCRAFSLTFIWGKLSSIVSKNNGYLKPLFAINRCFKMLTIYWRKT
jgi:hypothetical protein